MKSNIKNNMKKKLPRKVLFLSRSAFITATLSSTIMTASLLPTQLHASEMTVHNKVNSNTPITETSLLPAMGSGAAAGAIVAGPLGLLIGGLVGAFIGDNDTATQTEHTLNKVATAKNHDAVPTKLIKNQPERQPVEKKALVENKPAQQPKAAFNSPSVNTLQLAQIGIPHSIDNTPADAMEKLIDVFTTDLNLDVYFRSGSTDIENFYPARLAAVAKLMDNINQLAIHLDGYTDRRGDKTQNMTLAQQRIEKVREQLVNAGVDEQRIINNALGEVKMVSQPGDLEAYTFDRKVVIRFERASALNPAVANTMIKPEINSADPVVANAGSRF